MTDRGLMLAGGSRYVELYGVCDIEPAHGLAGTHGHRTGFVEDGFDGVPVQ